jgi:hypothetical protein
MSRFPECATSGGEVTRLRLGMDNSVQGIGFDVSLLNAVSSTRCASNVSLSRLKGKPLDFIAARALITKRLLCFISRMGE